mgnify:CR=1 FL=1
MTIAIIAGIILIYGIFLYNNLVRHKNKVNSSFADIDVQLKNRADLVENLVNTVKWYTTHEKWVLEWVTKARTAYLNADNNQKKMESDNMLTWALKSLFAVSENYPDLKANTNFIQLQAELSDLENKIAATRRFYNSTVREYDTSIEMFPSNLIASQFNFTAKKYYELEDQKEKSVPKVNFNTAENKTTKIPAKKIKKTK